MWHVRGRIDGEVIEHGRFRWGFCDDDGRQADCHTR